MSIDVDQRGYYNPRSMTKKGRLLKIEERAQDLIERSIGRLLGDSTLNKEIAQKLVNQVELGQHEGQVCDHYWVHIEPGELDVLLRASESIEEDLSRFLANYTEDADFSTRGPIIVILVPDEDVITRNPLFVLGCGISQVESTKALQAIDNDALFEDVRSLDAFFIDGTRHIPLDRPTISIGRHLENDIVVDSKAVSRRHAQIRWRNGKFVLHDLGSKEGTQKNGLRTRESVLSPGDVITVGVSSFVYGEGLTPVEHDKRIDLPGDITQALDRKNP